MRRLSKAFPGLSMAAVVLFAPVLGGCSPQAGSPQPPPTSSGPASPSPTEAGTSGAPTPSDVPSASGNPPVSTAAAEWTTFTTADGTMAFNLPAAWSVKDPAGELAEGGGAFAEVRNQAGKVMATLRTNMAIGSSCTRKYPYEVLDSADIPALVQNSVVPQFVFETRGNTGTPGPPNNQAAGYGITSGPAPTGPDACPILHFFRWPPTSAMFGAFYDPDNNATPGDPSLPYLDLAKKYRQTTEYADIRQMITSLRPVNR